MPALVAVLVAFGRSAIANMTAAVVTGIRVSLRPVLRGGGCGGPVYLLGFGAGHVIFGFTPI